MVTTIQISDELHNLLARRKLFARETFEEIIRDLLEDSMELNEETKKDISRAREEIRNGKTHSLSEVKKRLGL